MTQTRGGAYWLILPAGCNSFEPLFTPCSIRHVLHSAFRHVLNLICFSHADLGSSFWGMALVLASTNLMTARIAAGCLGVALLVVLFIAQNVTTKYAFTFDFYLLCL